MLKKLISKTYLNLAFATLGLAALAPGASQAAFQTSGTPVTKTAVAQLTQTVANPVTMSVSIHKVSDNSSDSAVKWNGVSLPAGWTIADDYIQLTSTMIGAGSAIQIYTNNTASIPKYFGNVSSAPAAGLVFSVDGVTGSSFTIPVAWSIKASTVSVTGPSPTLLAAEPNNNGVTTPCITNPPTDRNAFQWLYMQDKGQTVAINNLCVDTFVAGAPFVTVKETLPSATDPFNNPPGIHFGQANNEFGADNFPVPDAIYLEANFSAAVEPATYMTSTLTLEAFTQ